jgi:Zn-dependent protease
MDLDYLRFALYLAISLVPALVLHEYAHAIVAVRLGDPTPRRWGRLTLDPRPLIDPFGSLILPILALVIVAARGAFLLPVFAYAKPLPLDASYLRQQRRDTLLIASAGLAANVVLVFVGGIPIRLGASGELETFALAWMIVNAYMFGFQLMPVPGFDGSRLLAPVLPPNARAVYVNLEQYLVLFVLVIFFLLAGPMRAIAAAFGNVACNLAAGTDCVA